MLIHPWDGAVSEITKPCEPIPGGHLPNRSWLVSRSRRG